MNARFTCVLALVASAACNTRVSPFPDPIPPVNPPPPVIATNAVSGLVTSAGSIPVAGARVFLLDESGAAVPDVSAVTDAKGQYRIERLPTSPFFGTLVGASASAFFADHAWVSLLPDTRLDFTLDALTFIVLGDTIRARISDTMCAGLGYGGGLGASVSAFRPHGAGIGNARSDGWCHGFLRVRLRRRETGRHVCHLQGLRQISCPHRDSRRWRRDVSDPCRCRAAQRAISS